MNMFSNWLHEAIKKPPLLALNMMAGVVFIFFSWSIMTLCRWSYIVYPLPLNPDEVQAAANVLRIIAYGISWDSLDGTTVGPLNSLILSWPYLFGVEVTLSTIRATALALLCFTVLFSYLTIRALSGRFYAIMLSLPLITFYSLTTNPEFQHYSSELFSLALITAAIYLCVRLFFQDSSNGLSFRLLLGILGVSLGAVPFAKIQAAPIALTIASFAFLYLVTRKSVPKENISVSIFAIGGFVPAVIFLLPLILNGEFHHFWNSYIIWPTVYVKNPLSVIQIYNLVGSEQLLVLIFSLAFCLLILFALLKPTRSNVSAISGRPLFFVLILVSAIFSVVHPGNMFPHYLMFLPPLLLIMLGYFAGRSEPAFYLKYIYQLSFFGLIVFYVYPQQQQIEEIKRNTSNLFEWHSPTLFSYLDARQTDKLLIWGWMPQWYILSGLTPATRESMTNNQLAGSKLQSYFKQRLLSDLSESKPEYIIDAVAGKSFGFNNQAIHGIKSFDELARFVDSNYLAIHGIKDNSECAKTYVRKDKFALLMGRLVNFENVTASASWSKEYAPENIDDFSVTEDTCSDYWLLPDGKTGHVDIRFSKMESVTKILVLNTRNAGYMNHGTAAVTIELIRNGSIERTIKKELKKYPHWTEITVDTPVNSDSLRINILSFYGNGGGINEVKVVRSQK